MPEAAAAAGPGRSTAAWPRPRPRARARGRRSSGRDWTGPCRASADIRRRAAQKTAAGRTCATQTRRGPGVVRACRPSCSVYASFARAARRALSTRRLRVPPVVLCLRVVCACRPLCFVCASFARCALSTRRFRVPPVVFRLRAARLTVAGKGELRHLRAGARGSLHLPQPLARLVASLLPLRSRKPDLQGDGAALRAHAAGGHRPEFVRPSAATGRPSAGPSPMGARSEGGRRPAAGRGRATGPWLHGVSARRRRRPLVAAVAR